MAVNETLALRDALREDGLELDAVILNALYPARFDERELGKLEEALDGVASPLARGAVRAALSEHARAESQREQVERLRAELDGPLIELPYLFCERLGPEQLAELAGALEPALGDPASTPG
jgi:hypothetical protein